MNKPILKLPYKGELICSQANKSKGSHSEKYENTRHALDFTFDGNTTFDVLASADGIVKIWNCCIHNSGKCKCGLGFGNQVRIYHNGLFTFYSHLSKIFVKDNQKVKQGDIIGKAGKTGMAGDIHLHWSLGKESKESKAIDGKFIPFWSLEAKRIEIKENRIKKIVSSSYFKEKTIYLSTN